MPGALIFPRISLPCVRPFFYRCAPHHFTPPKPPSFTPFPIVHPARRCVCALNFSLFPSFSPCSLGPGHPPCSSFHNQNHIIRLVPLYHIITPPLTTLPMRPAKSRPLVSWGLMHTNTHKLIVTHYIYISRARRRVRALVPGPCVYVYVCVHIYTHIMYIHTYVYTYIYIRVCVCVCVCLSVAYTSVHRTG